MVDVMGTPARVLTIGLDEREEGQPVLFLQSGAGAPLETWGEWLSVIARLAPVVAYDRPGLGESPFDGELPTPERVAAHAHELMRVLGVDPPYVLVGHSWGGPMILSYAGRYPDEVVGMVYLDPSEPDLTPWEYLGASDAAEYASRLAEYDQFIARLNLPAGMEAERQAIAKFEASAPTARGLPEDPAVPTAVLLGTQVPSMPPGGPSYMNKDLVEELAAQRVSRYARRMREHPSATLIVATDAGHFVHRDAPGLAEEAVRRVVEAVAEAAAVFMVPEHILAAYVGDYELTPQFSIAVSLEDGQLFIQATNQPRFPVFAESETEFAPRTSPGRARRSGSKGAVSARGSMVRPISSELDIVGRVGVATPNAFTPRRPSSRA
jgi:pimeloyl-ACP methyl ester carboxylesterase